MPVLTRDCGELCHRRISARAESLSAASQGCDRRAGVVDGREVALSPGMAVTAEIMAGRRSVTSYVLSPLRRYADEWGEGAVKSDQIEIAYLQIPRGHTPLWFFAVVSVSLIATACWAEELRPAQTFRDCPQCPEMIVIPSGSFLMGSSAADQVRDIPFRPADNILIRLLPWVGLPDLRGFPNGEIPQHRVTIEYKIAVGKYLVTVSQFLFFISETGYSPRGDCVVSRGTKTYSGGSWRNTGFDQTSDDPVVCLQMDDIRAYLVWLNSKTQSRTVTNIVSSYRLPSESEWEYAARGGTATAWWWGNEIGHDNANCDGCGSSRYPHQPTRVGVYRPNPFGLYDMGGNVWQVVADCWYPTYLDAPNDGRPRTSGDCSGIVSRGGAFDSIPWYARSASRMWVGTQRAENRSGFRVVKEIR